jgi:splicing factor 3B subunit 3
MYLYNLTLQKTTGICQSITGSFTAPKSNEIIVSRGTILELMSVDVNR